MGLFFVDVLVLAAIFGFAAAAAELETYGIGIYIGSGLAVVFGSWPVMFLAGPVIEEIDKGWPRDTVSILLSALVAWLLTQLLSRWFYSADTRQANVMSAVVGIGQGLTLLFWRWAVS